jgi:hypothetical protein
MPLDPGLNIEVPDLLRFCLSQACLVAVQIADWDRIPC